MAERDRAQGLGDALVDRDLPVADGDVVLGLRPVVDEDEGAGDGDEQQDRAQYGAPATATASEI